MEKDRVGSGSSRDVLLSRMALNDNKAGMEGLDRDKINKIILEASKGSRFYENELKKDQQVNQRIERMMEQKDTITPAQLEKAHSEVERLRAALERGRDLSRAMVHVDMDAFYAAVEMRDNPELMDKPMAVGSTSMLSTSNYHARKFGVRAAMPGFIARKLCPNLVIVPTNFDKYRAVSSEIREIFADYDPHFQPLSLDEAFLDLTDHLEERARWPEPLRTHSLRSHQGEVQSEPAQETEAELSPLLFDDSPTSSGGGSAPGFPAFDDNSPSSSGKPGPGFQVFGTSAEEAVREMRFRIEQKTSLTASAGIAPNMLLAKVCSDLNKPNGQFLLSAHTHCVMEFIEKLPVRKVCGIGKVSEKMLGALGITSCAHLGQQMALLSLLFSETAWHHFLRISLGLGATHLERDGERKSMSTERTFREMSRAEDQVNLVRELCQDLSNDLKREGLKGKTVTLKLKNVQFEVRTRACSLPCAVWTAQEIYSVANHLLKTEMDSVRPLPLRLRLMGVRISSFVSSDDKAPQQRSIMGFLQQGGAEPAPPPPPPPPPPQLSSYLLLQPGRTDPAPELSSQTCGSDSSGQSPSAPPAAAAAPACTQLPSGQQHPGQPPVHPPGPAVGPVQRQQLSSGPEVQRSFFQRALAQRLRLRAEEEEEDHAASTSPTDTRVPKSRDEDTHMQATADSSSSPVASTSGRRHTLRPPEGLTCPVCFRRVDTRHLNVFNRHIDLCLSGGARSTQPQPAGGGREEREEEREEFEAEEEKGKGGRGDPGRSDDDLCVTATPEAMANATWSAESKPRRAQTNTDAFEHLRGGGAPLGGDTPLTCPVCQVTQATADLAVFNRHIDLCLNQEVLHQLKGQRSSTTSSSASPTERAERAKVKERGEPKPGTSNRHKGKRRPSPQSSPAKKKTKALNPAHHLNTLDRFFR